MELGIIAAIVAATVFGGVITFIVVNYREKTKPSQGTLNVDFSDPIDGPHLFLELKVPISDIVMKKRVVFNVNITHLISQE